MQYRTTLDVRRARRACAGLALVLLAGPAMAGDWYVDATFGDDGADGASATTAWRTLTHGIAAITLAPGAGGDTLHVAAGTYDTAHGEAFPLDPPAGLRIVGTDGPEATIVAAGGASTVVAFSPYLSFEQDSGLTGLTLTDADVGLFIYSGRSSAVFEDLVLRQLSDAGVAVQDYGANLQPTATEFPLLMRCTITQAGVGIRALSNAGSLSLARARVSVVESTISECTGSGIEATATGNASTSVRLERCRIVNNAVDGIYAAAGGNVTSATIELRNSLVAENGRHGLFGEMFSNEFVGFIVRGSTIAGNAVTGVKGVFLPDFRFDSSIIAGNGDDFDLNPATLYATTSNCPDGDLAGFPGCHAFDPRFIDPANGDYRVDLLSLCLDAADPADFGSSDLRGRARNVDGDLDALQEPDMGAFEFETLVAPSSRSLGEVARFELYGYPGFAARLFFTMHPTVTPVSTLYGELALDRSRIRTIGLVATHTGQYVFDVPIPMDPSLVGQTLAAQGLMAAYAPGGWALSNPVEVSILP